MISIYKELVKGGLPLEGYYKAEKLGKTSKHRVGINNLGQLCLFIYAVSEPHQSKPSLVYKYISVLFNKKCEIKIENESIEKHFSVITLKTQNQTFQEYFIRVFIDLLSGDILDIESLYDRVLNLFNLFTVNKIVSKQTIQGLFAELLMILASDDKEFFIKAWHVDKSSLYDFSLNTRSYLEVKSTKRTDRIHKFSNQQIQFLKKQDSCVVSVMVQESDLGANIIEVSDRIRNQLSTISSKLKLDKLILETINNSLDIVEDTKFELQYSIDSIKVFNSSIVPYIEKKNIPIEISNLKYDVNFEKLESLASNAISFKTFEG